MERGLFVVTETNETAQELLQEAATVSACSDAPLVILRLVTPEDIESVESADVTSDIDRRDYEDPTDRHFEEGTEEFVAETINGMDVQHEIAIQIEPEAERSTAVLAAAEEYDCDHVFLVGQRRSPTGKALFGDMTQDVILDFEGAITLSME